MLKELQVKVLPELEQVNMLMQLLRCFSLLSRAVSPGSPGTTVKQLVHSPASLPALSPALPPCPSSRPRNFRISQGSSRPSPFWSRRGRHF